MQMVPMPMNQPLAGPMPPGTQAVMVPNPMFRPHMLHRHLKKKWCKKHKKKKKKKEESDSSSESESEEESEYYYVGKSNNAQKKPPPANAANGGRKYEIFAPSHPQAVNQFIRDYNYSVEPKEDKNKELYQQAIAQYEADRLDDYYNEIADAYDWAYGVEEPYYDEYAPYDPYVFDDGYYPVDDPYYTPVVM